MTDSPIERAAEVVGTQVAAFVEAADRLVNLLTDRPHGEAAAALHQAQVDEAMNAYDRARRILTGEDVSSA